MNLTYYTLDVFTNRIFGGNQLAVFPDAHDVPEELMLPIAREFNLSETVFVLPAENGGTRKLRIFTPGGELPFAGHPTVGTAFLLAALGEVTLHGDESVANIVFEEGVGDVAVTIRGRGKTPLSSELTAAQLPEWGPPTPTIDELASVLGIDRVEIRGGSWGPGAVSCGVPFLFVTLVSRQALADVRINTAEWEKRLANYWAPSVYVICRDPELEGSDLRARMFAPAMGIVEDAATGSAASALGGFLARATGADDGTSRWVVEQGFEMGRPSLLTVEIDVMRGGITAVRVSGESVMVGRGEMTV